MKKDGKNKSKAAIIMMMLVLSMFFVLTTTLTTVRAAPTFEGVKNSYSGICGESIWINASGFDNGEYVWVNLSTDHLGTVFDNVKLAHANSTGKFNTTINVPWREETGDYVLSLTGRNNDNSTTHTFTITDIYKVVIDPAVIYWDDTKPQDFKISIYNWSDSKYKLLTEKVRYIFWEPDFIRDVINGTTSNGVEDTAALFNWSDDGTLTGNREANYTLDITSYDAPYTVLASIWVPVRFHLTSLTPTTATYGDTKTLKGRFLDGGNDYVKYLQYVDVVSPTGHMYYDPVKTNVYGDFTFAMVFNESGTWYVGTLVSGGIGRPTDVETTKNVTDFIWYGKVNVSSSQGTITVDPAETTSGFNIKLDIYCKDSNGDPLPDGSHVYVTGLETNKAGVTNKAKDFTELTSIANPSGTDNGWLNITKDDEFKFNESGTATFWVYYDQTWSYYDTHTDELPLISASTKEVVKTPSSMNVFVDYAAKAVMVDDDLTVPPSPQPDENHWINVTNPLNVTVYGKTDDPSKMKNASIKLSGCGIDQTIKETDQPVDGYKLDISPRNGGVLTVTVTNETSGTVATNDIEITGLASNAVTSVGGDKKITVDTNETITFTATDAFFAEVHLNLFDEDWGWISELNMTNGTNKAGNGLDGIYKFIPDTTTLGHIVISAKAGYGGDIFYTYDIVDIVPVHDLVINITTPDKSNLTLTAGIESNIVIDIFNTTGDEVSSADIVEVIWQVLDENNTVLENGNFDEVSGNTWEVKDQIFTENGTLLITATANEGKHDGNNSQISVELAEFTYIPSGLTIGINSKTKGVNITAKDAKGKLLKNIDFTMNQTDAVNTTLAGNSSGTISTDEFGEATIWFTEVGDHIGSFNALLGGVNTSGKLAISWPIFIVNPDTIYTGIMNNIKIRAVDPDGTPIPGINVTLTPSSIQIFGGAIPDPIITGADGWLLDPLSVQPLASGTLNVTIAQDVHYDTEGQLVWTPLLTDTVINVTSQKTMEISAKSPVFQNETLTVTVTSDGVPVKDVNVTFDSKTYPTDSSGKAQFTVPDPVVESATYYIKAVKAGYITQELGITVIQKTQILIVIPDKVNAGESFTITIIAKGQPLAGATVTLDGKTTKTSDGDGKVTFTAGAKGATHTITATFGTYTPKTITIGPLTEKSTPGFELLTLIVAVGIAFILLRRRKHN